MRTMLLLLLSFTLLAGQAIAQDNNKTDGTYQEGQILIQLKNNHSINEVITSFNRNENNTSFTLAVKKKIHHSIYLLEVMPAEAIDLALNTLWKSPATQYVQKNYKLQLRTEPNDAFYGDQWHMDLIRAPEAWDQTTGGVTVNGDTIVVAVLDNGIEVSHPDLTNNIYRNYAEIPNDGLDNDGNGYIDDHIGLNVGDGTDVHEELTHGTSVAGIIGAQGNNGIGVTGVNWNVKILPMTNLSLVSETIEAYYYIVELRRLYNETAGQEGAYIVSTNTSFGIDGQNCQSTSIWNAAYDSLGMVGIVSVAATTNSNLDIDENGDLPTSCPSDYLITVCNTDLDDQRVSSGYGAISIDLSAPGHGSFSTKPDDSYGGFGGTSGATPHVASAIALLYSLPFSKLVNSSVFNPSNAALAVKSMILEGVHPVADLANITTTGGRLDLMGAIEQAQFFSGGESGRLEITNITPNPVTTEMEIDFITPEDGEYTISIYNAIGQLMYTEEIVFDPFLIKRHTIDLKGYLMGGTYFLMVQNQNDFTVRTFVTY